MAEILQVNWRYAVHKSQKHDDANEEHDQGKYKLRAQNMKKRVENEDRLGRKRGARNKGGGPSKMSKYRRKTANARERMRMGEINVAYDRLKDTIPLPSASAGKQKCEKLTKINLLHIAINYIRTLQDILDTGDADIDIIPEKLILNPFHEKTRRESGCSSVNSSPAEGSITNDDMDEDEDDEDMDKSDSPDSGIQEDSDIECPDWTELNSTLDIRSQIVESANNFKENKVVSVKESSMNLSIFKKQSMLPNSTSNNTNFKFHNFITNADNKVTKCKPVTLTTRSSRSPNFQTDRRKKADIKYPLADTKKPLADISHMADMAKTVDMKPLSLETKQLADKSKMSDRESDFKPLADRHKIADIKHPLPLSQILKPLGMSDSNSISQAQLSACHLASSLSSPPFQMEQDELFNELNNSIDSFDGINDIDFCYDDPFKVF